MTERPGFSKFFKAKYLSAVSFVLFPVFLFPQSNGDLRQGFSLFEKEITLIADSLILSFPLHDSLLIPYSEKVWIDSVLLKNEHDYSLDYLTGTLNFKKPPADKSLIKIQYKIFPFSLKTEYSHREIILAKPENEKSHDSANSTENSQPQPKQVSRDIIGSQLRKSGSIIRGISVGSNQNLQVDSGLRMQISGQLTDNVEVVASLTDQNTPIQPEGNTQTLQEIDKVFVKIKGPNLQATLGDYNLDLQGSEFTRYSRKLEGIMGQADFQNYSVTLSAAVSRGQFTTHEFLGQEGNQGPYQLQGTDGQINIIVLAGTERVWVDGGRMARGENYDYVIDYGNGQITFTRHRLITSDSRITVDFQFSAESFQRDFFAARGQYKLFGDKVKFGATFIRESDDKDSPLNLELDEERLAILEAAGDSLAVVPGWRSVGQDSGVYIMDSTGIFIYVGPGLGDHIVSFSFFGENQGDYRNIGLGRFEFAGESRGSYKPFIILPKAQRHEIAGLNLELSPTPFFNIKSELAVSDFDGNIYSARDNATNQGSAYSVSLNFQPENIILGGKNLGRLSFSGKLRNKAENFRDIDRTTIAEFNRRWNISNSVSSAQENIAEFRGSYLPLTGVTFQGGVGRLSKSSFFKSNRWEFQTILNKKNLPKANYFMEFIDRNDRNIKQESTWFRQRGRAEYDWKRVKPSFEYEGEIRKDSQTDSVDSGFRFDSYTAGLVISPFKSLTTSAKYNVRDDKDRLGQTFLPKSIAKTQTYALSLRNWRAFNVTASYTHREREFSDDSIQDTRTDLADIRVGFSPRNGGIRSNFYYQASNTQVALQEEVFLRVKEGDGNFRFNEELNEFEPDPFGDFVRRLFTTKNFRPVIGLRVRADLRFAPKRFFKSRNKGFLQKALSPISSETFVRIDERTKEKDVAKIYFLQLDYFLQDSTIFGSREFRQDIFLWEKSRKFSIRYRYRNRFELNNQFVDGGQQRQVLERRFRVLYRFSNQTSAQVEFINALEDRIFQSMSRQDRKVRSDKLELNFVYRPQRRLELGLRSQVSRNRDIILNPQTRANLISFKPRSSYSLSNKGRLRGEIEWVKVDVSPNNRLIPFELTGGRRAGTTLRWNFSFDYRVSRNVQASMSYFGRNEPDRPKTQHFARVEMRAFF